MASLTDTLSSVSSSARPIDPQNNKGPTFLQGLASIAEQAVTGGSRLYDRMEADRQRASAEAAKSQKQKVEDATASVILDHGTGTGRFAPQRLNPEPQLTQDRGYVPIDAELEGPPLPEGVERRVSELTRARAAENQGRAPAGTSQITLESVISDLRTQFPDQENVILDYIKAQGFDHYLFRERDLERQIEDAGIKTELDARSMYYDSAAKAGLIAPGTPLEEGVVVGQTHLKFLEESRLAKEQREANQALAEAGRANVTFNQGQVDRQSAARATTAAMSVLGPVMTRIQALSVEALQNPNDTRTFEQAVPEFAAQIDQVINQYVGIMAANGETKEAIDAFRASGEGYKANLISLTSGPLSQFAAQNRTLESIQTRLKIGVEESLPLYSGLKEVFGAGGVAALFPEGVGNILPPEVIAEISGEIKGIRGAIDTSEEQVTMANIAALLRGKTGIDQMSEGQAQRVMPTLVATSRGEAGNIIQGTGNQTAYFNSTLQVHTAAAALQPGASRDGARSLAVASGGAFDRTATEALLKFNEQNPTDGAILIQSGRGASTNLLNALKSRNYTPSETWGGAWSVQYRRQANGISTYTPVLSRQGYDRWAANERRRLGATERGMGATANVPSYEAAMRNPPRTLSETAGSLNLNLDFLVRTYPFDEDFKGASGREVREFYANGTLPRAMRTRQEAEGNRGSFTERLQAIRGDFAEAATTAVVNQTETTSSVQAGERPRAAVDYFQGRGYPGHVAAGIVGNLMAESGPGLNTTAVGDGGQALSLAQWHPDRRREARANGYDLSDFNSALAFVDWELNNSEAEAGRRLKAARNVTEAADIFAQYFLRPKGAETGNANNIHNISGRRRNAQALLGN